MPPLLLDATLLTILLLLVGATVLALVRARKRDKCLKSFDGFPITLAEKGGDLTWGRCEVFATGLEVVYPEPVVAAGGHLERSFLFYKDQYEAIDALFRHPEGLTEEEQQRRREVIERTANPSFFRRLRRRVRNWMGMVRDALVQAASLVIGTAKARRPGSAVLSNQEPQLQALSTEIIGHAGNAYDPLLERHLFRQVVVEVTREGATRAYCGWLKDYTSQFIEVVDAFANKTGVRRRLAAYAPGDSGLDGVTIQVNDGRLAVQNGGDLLLSVERLEADGWARPMECVLPSGYEADLALPPNVDAASLRCWIGTCERVDLVVPRAHALVRHAADGSEARRPTAARSVTAEAKAPAPPPPEPVDAPADVPA